MLAHQAKSSEPNKGNFALPSFADVLQWLNHATPNASELKGRPTLVHFWCVDSEQCMLSLPQVAEFRDQRQLEGLRVIAVHLPRVGTGANTRAVRNAIARLNLTEPCALDNDHQLCDAFSNEQGSVPAYYLFDTENLLSSYSTGDAGLTIIESEIDQMLGDLRATRPFCTECKLFLNKEAMFCADCGLPLALPGSMGQHPYYEKNHAGSLPTVRLFDLDPLIGQILDGKYELTARLGEGGMSVVYRARRTHIGDEVAVKVLLGKFVADDAALIRFRREARAAAMLHHPNVITIHDVGETSNADAPAFIVMEFVRGTPLRELLKNEKHLSVERCLRLMRGICAGVGAAHRQGVVHRDLKPENILVVAPDDEYGHESVRVVDFGLAKLLAEASAGQAGTVVGTPHYMSPEQCLGEPLDTRSDVYSLGVMFYEMLCGEKPFTGETVSGVISKQLSDPPPPLPVTLAIPRRVSVAVMHALAKDPDDRPQNAIELMRRLQVV